MWNEHVRVCVHLLCSLCDLPSELLQSLFHILCVSVGSLAQRQGAHALFTLFARQGSLRWTQLSALTPERGAGL